MELKHVGAYLSKIVVVVSMMNCMVLAAHNWLSVSPLNVTPLTVKIDQLTVVTAYHCIMNVSCPYSREK